MDFWILGFCRTCHSYVIVPLLNGSRPNFYNYVSDKKKLNLAICGFLDVGFEKLIWNETIIVPIESNVIILSHLYNLGNLLIFDLFVIMEIFGFLEIL